MHIAIKQARRHYEGNIWIIAPDSETHKFEVGYKTFIVNESELKDSPELFAFNSCSWFDQTFGEFWSVTFSRLFYVEALIRKHSLENCIHLENDVLIYVDPKQFEKVFREIYRNKVAINPVGPKYATFAYGYIDNYYAIHNLNQLLLAQVKKGYDALMKEIGEDMVNEMMLLKLVADSNENIVEYLPSLPEGSFSKYYDQIGFLFDPASYGQYIGGTGSNNPGWVGDHHWIGKAIIGKKIALTYGNRHPIDIECNWGKFPLANLHIHSKELHKYVY